MKERLKNFHHSAVFICLVLAIVLDVVLEALGRHSLFKAISYVWNQPLIFLYNCSIIFFTLTLSLLMRKRIFGYCVISFAWLILGTLITKINHLTPSIFRNDMAVKQLSNMLENCEKIVAEMEEVPDSDLNMIDRKMKRFASNAIDEITLLRNLSRG